MRKPVSLAVLAHEVLHIARRHAIRIGAGNRTVSAWRRGTESAEGYIIGQTLFSFKTRIRAMIDGAAILSCKVKEVTLSQKHKERDFIQAKRAIERIRMAI